MRWWVSALVLSGLGLGLLVVLIPAAPMTGDGQHYIEFVRNGLQRGASSWHERRLLGPLIVRALPLDPLDGFHVLTLASLFATSLLSYAAARRLVPDGRALLAIPLLFGTWVISANLREFGLIDPFAWAFAAAVWLATVDRRWVLAAALGAIGVLAKEVVLLAAVAAAVAAWDRQRPWRSLVIAAPAALVAVLLTILFAGSGTDVGAYLTGWVRDGLGSLGPARVVYYIFAGYGALWLLIPRGLPGLPRHVRRAAIVYLLAAIVLPLVGSPERMEEAIFPAMLSIALVATRDWRPALAWAVAIGEAVFAARTGGDARLPTLVAWAGLALALALVASMSYLPQRVVRPARLVA
jgi:hypothetical protein